MGDWMIVPSDSDLLHHGRLGQKWGQRNGPPYPLGMSARTYKAVQKTGKVISTVAKGTGKAAIATGKAVSKTAKALKKHHDETKIKNQKKKEVKEQKKTEKMKRKAVSKNSYQELYDMKDRLTYNELKDAKERIRLEQEIYSLGHPKEPTLSDKISSVMRKVGMVNDWYKTGKSAWNNFCDFAGLDGKIGYDQKKQNNNQNSNQNNQNNQNNQKQNQKKESSSNNYTFNEGSQVVFFTGEYKGKNQNKSQGNNQNNNQNNQGIPNKKKKKKSK